MATSGGAGLGAPPKGPSAIGKPAIQPGSHVRIGQPRSTGGVGIPGHGPPPPRPPAQYGYGASVGTTSNGNPLTGGFGQGTSWYQQAANAWNAQPPSPTAPGGSSTTTPGTTPGTPGTPPQAPSPYDATYFADLNNATLDANAKIGQYTSDIANSRTNLQNTLDQLQYQNGLNVRNAQNAENARGGFAQGALGQQLGELNRSYQDTAGNNILSQGQQEAAWNAAITAAQQGLGGTELALAAASAARAVKTDSTDKSLGEPVKVAAGARGTPGSTGTTATAGPANGLTKGVPDKSLQTLPRSIGPVGPVGPVGPSSPVAQALAHAIAAGKVKGMTPITKTTKPPRSRSGGSGY